MRLKKGLPRNLIKNRSWWLGLTFLFLLAPVPILGEEAKVIHCNLESCINMAFLNHPSLKAGGARVSTAQALLEIKKAEQRPSLDLEGDVGYLSGESVRPLTVIGGIGEEETGRRKASGRYYQSTVSIEVPIIKEGAFLGQTSSSVQQARFGLLEKEWKNRSLRREIALKVAEAYIDLLKNLKAIKIHERVAASFEANYNLALVKFDKDLISRNDLLIAEVQLAAARRDLSIARLIYRRSQKALAVSMGLDNNDRYEINIEDIPGPIAPLHPLEDLVAIAQANHPGVRAQQFKVLESAEEVGRVQSEKYPLLSLLIHYSIADNFAPPVNDQWAAVFNLKVPLFDFDLIKKKAAVAQAMAVEEEKYLLDFKLSLEREINEIYFHIQELEEQVKLIKKQIEQASEALKLNQAMFQQGLLSQSIAYESEAALLRLQLALTAAEYDRGLADFKLRVVSWEGDIGG